MQTPKRKRYQKDAVPDDIITLIHLVRQNPALYNYKLQPNQRRRSDILNGWSQIANQIGNKYTVEECRRKWKNLRDTYHQYRLRKPKVGDGLSKWRYSKDLEFLSNIYQPKLKSHRQKYDQNFGISGGHTLAQMQVSLEHQHDEDDVEHIDDDDDGSGMVHHSNITLVSDDAETFILHAYEESVNDGVVSIDDHRACHQHDPDDPVRITSSSSPYMELAHDDQVEDVEEIVKNEHNASSLTDDEEGDGATGAEVGYEEVCICEEAGGGNAPNVDGETIIGNEVGAVGNSSPNDSKEFQYINTTEFCIEPVSMSTHGSIVNAASSTGSSTSKSNIYKSISLLASSPSHHSVATVTTSVATPTISTPSGGGGNYFGGTSVGGAFVQLQPPTAAQARDELDLFFEFLKNKMQRLSQVDITGIQIEFLNCVLRREAESVHK